jgi:hypothetical protein
MTVILVYLLRARHISRHRAATAPPPHRRRAAALPAVRHLYLSPQIVHIYQRD